MAFCISRSLIQSSSPFKRHFTRQLSWIAGASCRALGAKDPGVQPCHTHGTALLVQRGFGHEVETGVAKVFDWLSQYLSHPADGGKVLA